MSDARTAAASSSVFEVLPGLYRIETTWAARVIAVHVRAHDEVMLVDSGFPFTAEAAVIPALMALNISPAQLRWLVVTHASADHHGGAAAIKRWAPGVTLVAHEQDAGAVERHARFAEEHVETLRRDGFEIRPVDTQDAAFLALQGPETPVNYRAQGEEVMPFGPARAAILHHAPGHTRGHLIVRMVPERALVGGDAVMGDGIPDVTGRLVMPPHYFEVDQYLATIERVSRMQAETLLLTHYPVLRGPDVPAFLQRSTDFVMRCNGYLTECLRQADGALAASAVAAGLRDRIGIPDSDYQYALLASAHLRWHRAQGLAAPDPPGSDMWRWSGEG